jgi:hypothetical protein
LLAAYVAPALPVNSAAVVAGVPSTKPALFKVPTVSVALVASLASITDSTGAVVAEVDLPTAPPIIKSVKNLLSL